MWVHLGCRQNRAVVTMFVFSAKRAFASTDFPWTAGGGGEGNADRGVHGPHRSPAGWTEQKAPVVDIKGEFVDHRQGGNLSEPPSDERGGPAARRGGMELLGRSFFDGVSVTGMLRPLGQTRWANSTPAGTLWVGEP